LEWILNTPSHHRVHHAVDPQYLDKNYAGVFILWDRLLGTFEPETESPTYGTIEPLASWNPSWAHLTYGVKLARKALAMPTLWDGLQAVFRSPGWAPAGAPVDDLNARAAQRRYEPKYAVEVAPARHRFVQVTFVAAMLPGVVVLVFPMSAAPRWIISIVILWALTNVGGLTESRAWAVPSERARLALVGAAVLALALWTQQPLWLGASATAWAMSIWLTDVLKKS
jgi:hypothetical protein